MKLKKYRYTVIVFVIAFITVAPTIAQESGYSGFPDFYNELLKERYGKGEIKIIQDERLHVLVSKHCDFNQKLGGVPGYRIRIFANSGQTARKGAYGAKSRFIQVYPDIPVYVEYQEPNYKVYVGNYLTRSEALKALKDINRNFSNAFIVNSVVKFPGLK